jgi:type III secretion system HrpE/YscL family protein
MACKVIKGTDVGLGDISPDTGFAEPTARPSHKVVKGETVEARAEAASILARAKAEAEEIINEAELEAVRIKEMANEEGLRQGRDQGAQELSEIVGRTSTRLAQIEAQVEPQLRELALRIARKILGRELEFHPDGVVDIVKQALSEKARQRREIYLRVHPEDLQYIRENKAALLEVLSRAKEIGLREDPDVERHGVIIETDAGTIDAQLETQLSVFERVLEQAR